ncbi:MAG: putative metallopeptidase [Candidatus Pacearchaeota archaeon]
MKYQIANDLKQKAIDIINKLNFIHIKSENFECLRSRGTSTKGVIARCHGLNKVMQLSLKRKAFYVLEFISERFDKLSEEEQIKVIIHELLHIPKSFGGGFRHHDFVNKRNIERLYEYYKNKI